MRLNLSKLSVIFLEAERIEEVLKVEDGMELYTSHKVLTPG